MLKHLPPRVFIMNHRLLRLLAFSAMVIPTAGTSAIGITQEQQSAESREQAKAILNRAIEAHGLKNKAKTLRTARITSAWNGTLPEFGEIDITVTDTMQLPAQYRKDVAGKAFGRDFSLRWAIDGEKYWYQQGMEQATEIQAAPRAERQNHPYKVFERLAETLDKGSELAFLGKFKIDETDLVGVRIGSEEETAITCYFEQKSLLLSRTKQLKPLGFGPDKNQRVEGVYKAYKEFDAIRLPTKMELRVDDKKLIDIVVTDAKFPKRIDNREFAKP